jgi:hypothetical protein
MSAIAANATVEIRSATLGDTAAIREILGASAQGAAEQRSERACAARPEAKRRDAIGRRKGPERAAQKATRRWRA